MADEPTFRHLTAGETVTYHDTDGDRELVALRFDGTGAWLDDTIPFRATEGPLTGQWSR